MKSLFKRTLAAASSSVLALTQLATVAANVNVSAADTPTAASSTSIELPVKIDKESLLFVPISEETPEIGQHSDWNDKLEAGLLAMSGDKEFTDILTDEKETLKRNILKAQEKIENKRSNAFGCHLDAATVDEILSKISDTATGKLTKTGKITSEITVDDLGQIAGRLFEDEMVAKYGKEKSVKGDWSSFKIAGKIVVNAELNFDEKKVSYQVTFIDENGKKYTDDKGLEEYALKKLDEIYAVLKKAGEDAGKGANYFQTLDEDYARAKKDAAKVRQFADAVAAITGDSDDLGEGYQSFKRKLAAAVASVNTAKNGTIEDKITEYALDEMPMNIEKGWTDPRVTKRYAKAVKWINTHFSEYVDINLPIEDVKAIVEGATKSKYTVNGYSGEAVLEFEDDQKADVEKAIRDKYEATWEADGFKIVSIDSSKKLTASADTNYLISGDLFYDVERVITVVTEPIVTTTTTSDTTTSTTTTTTSTEPTTVSTEPTTSSTEPTTVSTTDTEPTTVSTTKTEPTTVSTTKTEPTSTSTEPTSTSTEPTSTSTEPTSTSTEPTTTSTEPTTTSTEPTTVSTTKTEPTTTSTEPTSTSTTPTTISTVDTGTTTISTSTTPGTYISFDIKGVSDTGLIYWSEEDPVDFDLSNISITLRIFENGEELKDKAIDVTSAFKPNYTSTEGMTLEEGQGCSAYPVDFLLKDVDAVKTAIKNAGYGDDLITQEGIREDKSAGHFTVYIVLRGDVDLDGKVTLRDVHQALVYYTYTMVSHWTAEEIFDEASRVYLKKMSKDIAISYFPYSHYAMDVDGDGQITIRDQHYLLKYYTFKNVSHYDDTTWEDAIGSKKVPREILHSQPLEYDTAAEMYKNAPRALED